MKGTIRRNGVLEPLSPYGCFDRGINMIVRHGNGKEGNPEWPHTMSVTCRYDKRKQDQRCFKDGRECVVQWDLEYVESLR
jgi:hypothetical protein